MYSKRDLLQKRKTLIKDTLFGKKSFIYSNNIIIKSYLLDFRLLDFKLEK